VRDFAKVRRTIHIRTVYVIAVILAFALAFMALNTVDQIVKTGYREREASDSYVLCKTAADDVQVASDFLTSQSRLYVMTAEPKYMIAFVDELVNNDRRGRAMDTLRQYLISDEALSSLESAVSLSDDLVRNELLAMRLIAIDVGYTDLPDVVAQVELPANMVGLSSEEAHDYAERLLFGDSYLHQKDLIAHYVGSSSDELFASLEGQIAEENAVLQDLRFNIQVQIFLLVILVGLVICATIFLILKPLAADIHRIKNGQALSLQGAYELRYLSEAYNAMREELRQYTLHLKHAAEHDPLTGLFNRGAYDALVEENSENAALLLIDVDKFKDFNDTYGHDMGDKVLQKVASSLIKSFRHTDYPCRIGGDEFAVIMTEIGPELKNVVESKIERVRGLLADSSDGVPKVTLSIGVAFTEAHQGQPDIFKAADNALYVVKDNGRNGYAFYQEP